MDSPVIETRKLTFRFGSGNPILTDLNLSIPKGSIYGFLGPNGAGKTTTLRLIVGLLRESKADIRLFGTHLKTERIQLLRKIGTLIEQPSLYAQLTGKENLEVYRLVYGCSKARIDEVLQLVGLSEAANKKTKVYSLGMKQRLAIGIALLHDPELLILDEPTNGLDPAGIIEIRDLIRTLNQQNGKSILISSHLLAEIEKIATHVGIINQGRLLFQGTLSALQQLKSIHTYAEFKVNDPDLAMRLAGPHFPVSLTEDRILTIQHIDEHQLAQINQLLVQAGVKVYRMGLIKHDLEDLFLQILADN